MLYVHSSFNGRLDEIISCDLWDCPAGYTNRARECGTLPSPYGRRLQATAEDYADDAFYTTDGYTTLGDYPICSEKACCYRESPLCGLGAAVTPFWVS